MNEIYFGIGGTGILKREGEDEIASVVRHMVYAIVFKAQENKWWPPTLDRVDVSTIEDGIAYRMWVQVDDGPLPPPASPSEYMDGFTDELVDKLPPLACKQFKRKCQEKALTNSPEVDAIQKGLDSGFREGLAALSRE